MIINRRPTKVVEEEESVRDKPNKLSIWPILKSEMTIPQVSIT